MVALQRAGAKPAGSFTLTFDGSCAGQPGQRRAGFGWHVTGDGGTHLAYGCGPVHIPEPTCNVAEYSALLDGLTWLVGFGVVPARLTIRGDSLLVIRALRKRRGGKNVRLNALLADALRLLDALACPCEFVWVPRAANDAADGLAAEGRAGRSALIVSAVAS